MEPHITQRKPGFFKLLLNYFGLIDLHTKVNCWFCNQDSYILPGTKNTTDHWFCHLCENTNARDQNGDIIDPTPFHIVDKRFTDIPPPPNNATTNNNGRALCKTCQENQTLIYQMMSEYIPEENDPLYEERCATADSKHAELHQLYKICPNCQKLIDQVVAEQKEILKRQNIDRIVFKSLNENTFINRPTRQQYFVKGIIWSLTHAMTLVFVYYVMLHPPSSYNNNTIMNWDYLLTNYLKKPGFDLDFWRKFFTAEVIQEKIEHKLEAIKEFMGCLLTSNDTDCNWNINDSIVYLIFFNFLSLKSIDWNRGIKPIYYEKVKHLELYKKYQVFLFIVRFLLLCFVYVDLDQRIILAITAFYISILYLSDKLINRSEGVTKEVNNSFILKEDEPMDTYEDMELSVEEIPDEMTTIINKLQGL